jgi:hypothetical protein
LSLAFCIPENPARDCVMMAFINFLHETGFALFLLTTLM